MSKTSADILAKFKKFAIGGATNMQAKPPIDLSADLADLVASIEALPLEKESFNEEDRPYQRFFQTNLNAKVFLLSQFPEVINDKFPKGAFDCYRYVLSLIKEIEADDQLLAIGKKLEVIADKVLEWATAKYPGSFHAEYYANLKERLQSK